MFPLNTILAWNINIIMNKKYDNNNIIIASRAYFLQDDGIICGRLVSSQLSVQLPQNSGARGKGNWPSEVSRLQYLAGCRISWRCDVISKQTTKSKPNTRKVMAGARNWEIYSNRSKERAKAWEGKRTGFGSARAGTGLSSRSNPAEPELVRPSQSRPAKALLPLC
jgi:hypothetical protein